jgi:hypothetical protein
MGIVGIFTALAVVFTWPLARHLGDSIPGDLGDPLLNASILGWDGARLKQALLGVWDAPIFYPYRQTLAFSEHLLGIAVFVAPLHWATGNPLVAYNAAFLLSFVLAGVGMFTLVRELTGRDDSAWIAGLIFAFMPARLGQIGHLQVLMSGWMPLALWALHRFLTTTSTASLAAFVAFALLQSLSNNYFIYFLFVPAALVAADGLYRAPPDMRPRLLRRLAVAAALIVAPLVPIGVAYFDVRRFFGFRRTLQDAANFGADLAAYFHGNEAVRPPLTLWRHLPFVAKPAGPEGELFVGALALALAAVGIVAGYRRRRESMWSAARVYSVVLAAALLLSLGSQPTAWGVRLPIGGIYQTLFAVWPGFDGLRVPARLSVVVDLAIAVLAGIGTSALLKSSRRPIAWSVAAIFTMVILLEGYPAPIPLAFVGRGARTDRAAYNWVREQALGPILELPTGEFAPILQSYRYEYETLFHRRPIVNGASGYDTALHLFLGRGGSPLVDFQRFAEGVKLLRGIGVRAIVVHPQAYLDPELAAATLQALRADPQIAAQAAFPGVQIFHLATFRDEERPERQSGRDAAALADDAVKEIDTSAFGATASDANDRLSFAFDRDIDTRWGTGKGQEGNEFIELTFTRPYEIARLRLMTRSFGDYPRHLVVKAADDRDEMQTVYDGPVVFQLGIGLVRDPIQAPLDVWLRPNHTRRLRLLQTGNGGRRFWSIHELSVWESLPVSSRTAR